MERVSGVGYEEDCSELGNIDRGGVEANGMDEMSGEMVVKSKKEKDTKRFGGGGRRGRK